MSPEQWLASQSKPEATASGAQSPEEWLKANPNPPALMGPKDRPSDVTGQVGSQLKETFGWDPQRMHAPDMSGAMTKGGLPGVAIGAGIGSIGGPVGALTGGLTGGVIGAAGGGIEELLSSAGFGPGTAMMGGMLTPGGGLAQKGAQKLTSKLPDPTWGDIARFTPGLGKYLRGIDERAAERTAEKFVLNRGAPSRQAESQVGESLRRGSESSREQFRLGAEERKRAIEQRYQQQLQEQQQRVSALRGEMSKAKQAQLEATNATAAELSGLNPVPPSELGRDAMGVLTQRLENLQGERSREYERLFSEYIDFARTEQAAGRPWQSSPTGKKTLDNIRGLMEPSKEMGKVRPMTTEEEKAVKQVLDEIEGVRTVKVEEPYPETRTTKEPLDIRGIDNVVRKLGEAAKGQPPEGYQAINKNLALKMKKMLSEGLYEWAPAGSAAKRSYREGSEKMEAFVDSQIDKVTRTSSDIRGKYTTDPQSVTSTLFKSPQSVKDFKEALGGDSETVRRLATQHVNNQLHALGGNPAKVERWLTDPKNKEWMKEAGIEGHGQSFLGNLKDLTRRAEGAGKGVAAGEKKLGRDALQARDAAIGESKTRALEQVRKEASAYERRMSDAINASKYPETALENLLNSGSKKSIQTIAQLLDEGGRKAMPDAVRQYMSRGGASSLADRWNKVKPMLEHGKLMGADDIAKLDADVTKAIEALRKTPAGKTRRKVNDLAVRIASKIGGTYAANEEL